MSVLPVDPIIPAVPVSGSSSPATANELVHFIGNWVRGFYTRTGYPRVNGAMLANAVRQRYPELRYPAIGLLKLSDAVKAAELQGLLVRHRDVSHLEVSPAGIPASDPTTPTIPQTASSQAKKFLRPEIWKALIFFRGNRRHYFDRVTAAVKETEATSTEPVDANRFVPIEPIPAATVKDWMQDFAKTHQLDSAAAPINEELWWTKFSDWLRGQSPDLERQWRTFRSQRVIDHASAWAKDHEISTEAIFATPLFLLTRAPRGPMTIQSPSLVASAGRDDTATTEQLVRKALVDAINEMPIEQLAQISVPIRYLLRHLKSR